MSRTRSFRLAVLLFVSLGLLSPLALSHSERARSQAATSVGAAAPAALRPGRLSLQLTWSGVAHVGVPVTLTIAALDGAGQADPSRGGPVTLQLSDPQASVWAVGVG